MICDILLVLYAVLSLYLRWMKVTAAIGILLSAGADRDNFCSVYDLWDPAEGNLFTGQLCLSTGSNSLFVLFASTTLEIVQLDFRMIVWQLLVRCGTNWCQICGDFVPEDTLTVDEQLVGFRRMIPGHVFLQSHTSMAS